MPDTRETSTSKGLRGLLDRATSRLSPEARRRLLRFGIVVGVLVVFVVVPILIAESSGFLGRYPNHRTQHETRPS